MLPRVIGGPGGDGIIRAGESLVMVVWLRVPPLTLPQADGMRSRLPFLSKARRGKLPRSRPVPLVHPQSAGASMVWLGAATSMSPGGTAPPIGRATLVGAIGDWFEIDLDPHVVAGSRVPLRRCADESLVTAVPTIAGKAIEPYRPAIAALAELPVR
jgi:hypothetical protein